MTLLYYLYEFFRKVFWPYLAPVIAVCLITIENMDYVLVFQVYLAVPILLNIYPTITVLRGDIPFIDFMDLIGYQMLTQSTLFVCMFLPPSISRPIVFVVIAILVISLIRNIIIQIIGKNVECELVYWNSLTWGEFGTSCFITLAYEYNNLSYEHTEKYWGVPATHSKLIRKVLPNKPFHCYSYSSIVYNIISIFLCIYIFSSGEIFEIFFFLMFLPLALVSIKVMNFFSDGNNTYH